MFKRHLILLILSIVFIVPYSAGLNAKEAITITPDKDNWGKANPVDVKAVALSSAQEILKYFPDTHLAPIILRNKIKNNPIVLFKRGKKGEYIIGLNVKDQRWAQIAYQFSHELMHVLSNYDNSRADANQWFEEALCEAASIQAVKDMSISWKTKPPYPNWKSYASSLSEYYQDLINEKSRQLAKGDSLSKWYKREKKSLRADAHQRDKNEIVANRIFTFFNASPERWHAVKYLNIGDVQGNVSLQHYLKEWEKALPKDLKYVAKKISSWFN